MPLILQRRTVWGFHWAKYILPLRLRLRLSLSRPRLVYRLPRHRRLLTLLFR